MVYSCGVSEIPNQTTCIRILIENVSYHPSLNTDFGQALYRFLQDQGLMTDPDVRLQVGIDPPTPMR